MSFITHNNNILLDATGKPITADFGITPTGTKTITENGTYDISAFASALVNIPQYNVKMWDVTYQLPSSSIVDVVMVHEDADVASHRLDEDAWLMVLPKYSRTVSGQNVDDNYTFEYCGNRVLYIKNSYEVRGYGFDGAGDKYSFPQLSEAVTLAVTDTSGNIIFKYNPYNDKLFSYQPASRDYRIVFGW